MGRSHPQPQLRLPPAQLASSDVSDPADGELVARPRLSQQDDVAGAEPRPEAGLVRGAPPSPGPGPPDPSPAPAPPETPDAATAGGGDEHWRPTTTTTTTTTTGTACGQHGHHAAARTAPAAADDDGPAH